MQLRQKALPKAVEASRPADHEARTCFHVLGMLQDPQMKLEPTSPAEEASQSLLYFLAFHASRFPIQAEVPTELASPIKVD